MYVYNLAGGEKAEVPWGTKQSKEDRECSVAGVAFL